MAIRIVDGVPGSGKSYYAVHHLLHKYFEWDTVLDEWRERPLDGARIRVFSNIDALKCAESLDEAIAEAGGLAKFFTVDYQRTLSKDGVRCIYVIDEAQRMFPRTFKDVEVAFYFQYHRHLGADVYLITQDVRLLALELRHLAEYIVRAVRRTYSVIGEFRYRLLGSHEDKHAFQIKVLKRDRRVFAAYSSMVQGESEKIGSAPRRFMYMAIACGVAIASLFGWLAYSWSHKMPRAEAGVRVGPSVGLGEQRRRDRELERAGYLPRPLHSALAGPPRVVPPVVEAVVVVQSISGDTQAGSVTAIGGDELYHMPLGEFVKRCRCMISRVRTGQRVSLYADESLPRLADRASGRPVEGKANHAVVGAVTPTPVKPGNAETPLPTVGRSVLPFQR